MSISASNAILRRSIASAVAAVLAMSALLPAASTVSAQLREEADTAVTHDSASVAEPAVAVETTTAARRSDGQPAYFFGNRPGSDQYVGPFDVILNKGFNMAQAANRERAIFSAPYGWSHVKEAALHPVRSIENSGGWGHWLEEQIVPVQAVAWARSGFDWDAADNMTWFPNYFGHFIEGGITSRRLAEKFRADGVPMATVLAAVTTMSAAVVNEAYTHPELTNGTGGTVADLYIFDLGGVVALSFDPIARFFAETLHANVWPSQAALTLPGLVLANNANNLVFKLPIPFVDRFSLFVRTAVGSHVGLTTHFADGLDLSIGFGADTDRHNIDPATGSESVDLRLSSSIYLDRGGSVLASLYISEVDHRLVSLNIYPGVLDRDFGAWLAVARDGSVQLGLSHRLALGLGFGVGF